MSKFEKNQKVKVPWPEWQAGEIGTVVEEFQATYEDFYVVDVNGERYTYKESELEAA